MTARVVSKSSAVAPSNTTLAPKDNPWISPRKVLNCWRNVSKESVVETDDAVIVAIILYSPIVVIEI